MQAGRCAKCLLCIRPLSSHQPLSPMLLRSAPYSTSLGGQWPASLTRLVNAVLRPAPRASRPLQAKKKKSSRHVCPGAGPAFSLCGRGARARPRMLRGPFQLGRALLLRLQLAREQTANCSRQHLAAPLRAAPWLCHLVLLRSRPPKGTASCCSPRRPPLGRCRR